MAIGKHVVRADMVLPKPLLPSISTDCRVFQAL
jgi:hypothetical protein